MATKKQSKLFIDDELAYLEERINELKAYIDANPVSEVKDRFAWKETKNGGAIPIVVASKEAQRKDWSQALKDYSDLLIALNNLRAIEASNLKVRGNQNISGMASKWLKGK